MILLELARAVGLMIEPLVRSPPKHDSSLKHTDGSLRGALLLCHKGAATRDRCPCRCIGSYCKRRVQSV